MQRRGASGQPVTGQSANRPKARNAPTAQVSGADLQKQVDTLTRELSEAREQQTATSDVLKVISRSTFDLQTVLDTLVKSAAQLCEADDATIHRPKDDAYPLVANYGYSHEYLEYMRDHPIKLHRGSVLGRAVLEGKVIQVADVLADPNYAMAEQRSVGKYRTVLGAPLMREGTPIGVIMLTRSTVRPFTDKQVELVSTFADQAVIAIENVRLFNETKEALEQQTATSEVLRVISSSPGELEPVFRAVLENATRICEAKFGTLHLQEGDVLRPVATHNAPPAYIEARMRAPLLRPPPDAPLGRLAITKQVVHIADIKTTRSYNNWQHFLLAKSSNQPHKGFLTILLGKSGKRRGSYRTPEKSDELAPPHYCPRGSGQVIVSDSAATLEGDQCPLWVISGHLQCKMACPLYPQ
jgi:hypothetical protein